MNAETLAQVVFISYVLSQIVHSLIRPAVEIINMAAWGEPIKERILELWPLYVTVSVAGVLGWFTNANLLPMFDPPALGKVLTAIGIGLGPSWLYDTFLDKPTPNVVVSVPVDSLIAQTEKKITDQVTKEVRR